MTVSLNFLNPILINCSNFANDPKECVINVDVDFIDFRFQYLGYANSLEMALLMTFGTNSILGWALISRVKFFSTTSSALFVFLVSGGGFLWLMLKLIFLMHHIHINAGLASDNFFILSTGLRLMCHLNCIPKLFETSQIS